MNMEIIESPEHGQPLLQSPIEFIKSAYVANRLRRISSLCDSLPLGLRMLGCTIENEENTTRIDNYGLVASSPQTLVITRNKAGDVTEIQSDVYNFNGAETPAHSSFDPFNADGSNLSLGSVIRSLKKARKMNSKVRGHKA